MLPDIGIVQSVITGKQDQYICRRMQPVWALVQAAAAHTSM